MEKGYWPNWSDQYYLVKEVVPRSIPFMYKLVDLNDKILQDSFYEEQLQKLPGLPELHRIEKVIRRNKNKLLVKWMGWSSAFDSWIDK